LKNPIDSAVSFFSPERGLRRVKARDQINAAYETATRTRTRNAKHSTGDGNRSVGLAGSSLREQARHLDENHDLATGVLSTLVNNTVGPNGISIEPQPKNKDGQISVEFAQALASLHKDWSMHPEVTGEHDRAAMERLMARSWFRDGEYFVQHLSGRIPTLDHGTKVPYSVELLEADMVPLSFADNLLPGLANGLGKIRNGVEKNAWGKPIAYHVYFEHPGSAESFDTRTKRIGALNITHGKLTTRIRQTRGVSALAPVMTRLNDLKDYEESERVAARVSAAAAFAITKGSKDMYTAEDNVGEDAYDDDERSFDIAPGIVFDNLEVGEEVSDISSSRPSALLQPFRDSMLRAVAAGTNAGASSISRNYDGSYSAQRQELVEQFGNYSTLTAQMVGQYARPAWIRFVTAAIAARLIVVPASIDPESMYDAEFRGPTMPWIDPVKEANANLVLVQAGFKSQSQVIRERGGSPQDTMAEIKRERDAATKNELTFSTVVGGEPASDTTPDQTPKEDKPDGEDKEED
jgi:lambda family phage portal protein